MLNEQDDKSLRGYARRLHSELGEDAYHNVICEVLKRQVVIKNEIAFFHVTIKRAIWKIFRHEKVERERTESYVRGDPPTTMVGLLKGHMKQGVRQSHCRRGHELIEGNLVYIGKDKRRTCKTCRYMKERVA